MEKALFATLVLACLLALNPVQGSAEGQPAVLSVEDAVRIALDTSPILKKTAEDIEGARFGEKSVKAEFFPTISASYTLTALHDDPYMITAGGPAQVAHGTQYNWGLSLVQPLFTGHALTSRLDMTKLNLAVKEKEREQAILDVTLAVRNAYNRALLSKKILSVADEALSTLRSHEKNAAMFHERGVIRLNDLLRARVAVSGAVQKRERAKADADIALADLNRWLGRDLHTDTVIEDIEAIRPVHENLDELIETGLRQRPQIQAMEHVGETLEKAVTLEKSAFYPQVAAIASYWRNGDSPLADTNDFENDHNASLVVQATWTVFDGNKTRARVGQAASEKRAHDQAIREVKDRLRVDIQSAWLNLGVAENTIKTAGDAVAQAEENFRITGLAYRQEAATSTEVLDARTDLTDARTRFYQALYGYLDAMAVLDRAVGRKAVDEKNLNTNP